MAAEQPDTPASMGATISRRSLLLGTAAALTFPAGCSPSQPAGVTVDSLVSQTPFYIAHRGGWRNWPEMTAYAYDQAVALPHARAIEISVCVSADGVLVCSHDPTTTRVTGTAHEILKTPWSELAPLMVTSKPTDDPAQPPRPFSRLDDVIDRHIQDTVVFIEPKVPEAVQPLKAKVAELSQPTRIVWKQPINSRHFGWAKSQGFSTWGYALDEPAHSGEHLTAFARDPAIDMLGVEIKRPDDAVSRVVELAAAAGKKTIMWSIVTADQRRRALTLGCQGLMTADIKNLPAIPLA